MTCLPAFRTPPRRELASSRSSNWLRGGAVLGLALGAGLVGCDSTATIFPQRTSFSHAEIVSAFPAKKDAQGNWERVCDGGPVDGLLTNVVLVSTVPKTGDSGPRENDLSIRPGDVIETRTVNGGLTDDIDLQAPGNFGFQIDCIDPAPQPNPSAGGCQGATPASSLEAVSYVARTPARGVPHNVLLLLDQSGSIGGIVDTSEGNKENQENNFTPPGNFGDLASDRQSLRLAAARTFAGSLNEEDQLGVIAFGEKLGGGSGFQVPCADASGKDVNAGLDACFGRNRDLWTAGTGIDSLLGQTAGRSNLWKAVQTAYRYLKNSTKGNGEASNHIVILTDGPDTCVNGENITNCASACSTVEHDEVLAELEADRNDPNAKRIEVSFIQFESIGYPGRDPRQVEAACISGGHYQYINTNEFPREQLASRQESFDQAFLNVRFALMGHWELAAEVAAYSGSAAPPTGTLPGSLYALSGKITVRQSSNMVTADRDFPFGKGIGVGAKNAPSWDRRPTVLKPCGGPADCGGSAGGNACQVICSDETHICPGGAGGMTLPDTAACDSGNGSGFCCDGACQPSGACGACTAN